MIHLEWPEAFASGGKRGCFVHPDDPNLCIKVDYSSRGVRSTLSEAKFLQRKIIAHRIGAGAPFSKFHGRVKTSLGDGSVFTLIRDHDGTISKTLSDVIKLPLKPENHERYDVALADFRTRFLDTAVICRDIAPYNILSLIHI